MKRSLWLLLFLAALPVTARAQVSLPAEKVAARTLEARNLRAHIDFLASDLLEGRGPGSRGDALTQRYLATQFELLGLKPGAPEGGFLQPFELVGVKGHPDTLTFTQGGASTVLRFHEDFIASAGQPSEHSVLDGSELVFVGYGIQAPEYAWDDFKGMDLTGKTLLFLNNDPDEDPALFAGRTRLRYGRWDYKYAQAVKQGAAGALLLHTTPSAGYPWQVVQTSWSGEQFELPASAEGSHLEVKGWMTEEATRRVLQAAGHDLDALRAAARGRDFQPVSLGVKVSTRFDNQVRRRPTANVLALLPGSDPTLAREVVLYTAHHDHLGMKADAKPGEDAIYNGAVDNASGVAALLEVARAFTRLPKAPPRSLLFAAVAAEEQGLLGSSYLAGHLPVADGRVAANINLDGLNIHGRTRDVTVIGLGKCSLDEPLTALVRAQGRVVKPDQLPDRGFFYRSDQYSFAQKGIPTVYFSSGMDFIGRPAGWGQAVRERWEREHYHQPSDELAPDADLSGAVEDVRLAFLLGANVARTRALPHWNPGDEFQGPRQRALDALKSEEAK
jgi:Zn-dependent M28 family amino/carboxypeptidase